MQASVDPKTNMENTWSKLSDKISESTLKSLDELQFVKPTPVQAACIPLFLNHKDVAAEAVTGSGKTLAFVIPIFEIIRRREDPWKKNEIGAVIVSPTRDLASQIYDVVKYFLKHFDGLTSALVTGGKNSTTDDELQTHGANILVGTPGRLEALFEKRHAQLDLGRRVKSLEVLVLDEADRLLDLGFEASLNTILSYIPKQRRTGLFSATQTDEVEKLIRAGLRNPVRVSIKEKGIKQNGSTSTEEIQRTPSSLQNYYMIVDGHEKFDQLVHFLNQHRKKKMMLFLSTCAAVDYFSKILPPLLKKSQVYCIHGKMKSRTGVISKFRGQGGGVLVCTDVMARGIDIPEVQWVIQYDPPTSATAFVHRCGRTARIGNQGSAVLFLQPHEESFVEFIQINQKVPLVEMSKLQVTHNYMTEVQTMALNDRAVFDKGVRAYVSFVQSYAKHECYLIFQMKKLDFGKLATGFGLLRIPRMPETKGLVIENFSEVPVDISTIEYLDKNKESTRQQKIKDGTFQNAKKLQKRPPKSEAWSQQKEMKEKKAKRKKIKELKREKRQREMTEEDLDDLDDDIRMIKKLKRKKITQEEFDQDCAAVDDLEDANL